MKEPATDDEAAESQPASHKTRRIVRLVALVGVILGLLALGKALGAEQYANAEKIQELLDAAGIWAVPAFLVIFTAGELVHIPGVVFVAGACAFASWLPAYGLSLCGAVCSATVSFVLVRTVAGRALTGLRHRWIKKMLSMVDDRPIRTVVILRLILWMAPALNYALALTNIRFRNYLIGSAVGLALPVLGLVAFFKWLFEKDIAELWRTYWPLSVGLLIIAVLAVIWWRLRARRRRATEATDGESAGDESTDDESTDDESADHESTDDEPRE